MTTNSHARSIADMSIEEIIKNTSSDAVSYSREINRKVMAKRPVGEELI